MAVHLYRVAAGGVMQTVDVLSDHTTMKPPASSRASASCAGFGRISAPTSGSAQHCQTRAGSRLSMSTWPSTMGSRRSQRPPGERKSGKPLAVETPAPVSASTGAWRSRKRASTSRIRIGDHADTVAAA